MNLMGKGMKSSCPWSCFCSCWLFHTMLTVYVSINTKTSPIKGLFFFFSFVKVTDLIRHHESAHSSRLCFSCITMQQ